MTGIEITLELHSNLELQHDDWAELRIVDDGIGFSSDASAGQGMGLRIMHYRAGLVGGQMQVGSGPGGGTQVLCRVPSSALVLGQR